MLYSSQERKAGCKYVQRSAANKRTTGQLRGRVHEARCGAKMAWGKKSVGFDAVDINTFAERHFNRPLEKTKNLI